MKKKTIAILGLATACCVATSVLLAVKYLNQPLKVDGELVTYTMDLTDTNQMVNTYQYSETRDRGYGVTSIGSEVELEYTHGSRVTSTASFIEFPVGGGNIINIEPLNGLVKLEYKMNRDMNIHYGFSPNNLRYGKFLARTGSSWEEGGTLEFDLSYGYPAYFKIDCPEDVQIFQLKFYYTCIPSIDPFCIEGEWEYTINSDNEAVITSYHIDSANIPEDGLLIVPDELGGKFVRFIEENALANVPWVRHIALPFIGQSWRNEIAGKSHEFGSIFASSLPTGSTYIPMQQHSNLWFVPANLTTVTVYQGNRYNESVQDNIPDYAFYGMSNLTTINLYGSKTSTYTNGIEKIFSYAFANCSALKELHLPETICEIGEAAFAGNEDMLIRSDGDVSIGVLQNPDHAKVTENYCATTTYKGVIYDLYYKNDRYSFNAIGLTSTMSSTLRLDEDIPFNGKAYRCRSVANRAFCDYSHLERIYLPSEMEYVGHLAFKGAYRASILLGDTPDDLVYVTNWNKDTGLTVPNHTDGATVIQFCVNYDPLTNGYFADFISDSSLTNVQLDQFDINVPIYVASYFGEDNTKITSVSLPKNVTLGNYSFFNCTNLTTVQYAGTVSEWEALVAAGKTGINSFANSKVTQIICNGGTTPVMVAFTAPVV